MEKEIQEVLDELHQVNIDHLTGDAKRLYEAIMKIADERDIYKTRIDKAIEYINSYLPNYDFDHSNLEKLLEILRGKDER